MSEIGKIWVNLELKNKEFIAAIDATNQRLDKLAGASSHLVVTFGDIMNYGGKLAGALWDVATSAGENELLSKRLSDAMKAQGVYTDEAYKENIKFAESLSLMTKYSDDEIMASQQLLTSFGLHDAQMRRTAEAAVNLASRLRIDLHSASMLLGKAFEGNTETLSRYGISIADGIPKGQKFAEVLKQIAAGGDVAKGEAETFNGKLAQLKNSFDNLKESIGDKFLPVLKTFVDTLKDATQTMERAVPVADAYAKMIIENDSRISKATGLNAYQKAMQGVVDYASFAGRWWSDYLKKYSDDIVASAERAGRGAVAEGQKTNAQLLSGAKARSKEEIRLDDEAAAAKIANDRKTVAAMDANIRKEIQAGQEKNKKLAELSDKLMKEVVADAKKQEAEEVAAKQRTIAQIQEMTTAYGATLSNFATYQNTLIQNDLQADLAAEQQKYDTKKAWIEANITDEEKKSAMLRTLEQEHGDNQARLQKEAEKRQEEAHRKMKPLLIAEALANTAVGVTKAFAQGGVLGFITGGLVAAAGAAQVAIIDAQKFAEGGIVGGSSYTGDNVVAAVNSGEMILNQSQQARLFDMANGRGAGGQQTIMVNLDGKVIAKATAQNFPSILRLYGATA